MPLTRVVGWTDKIKVAFGMTAPMPLLQFDIAPTLSDAAKTSLAERVTEFYTTEMATTAGHIAVTIRERDPAEMHLGRAVDGPLLFLDAEIRRGRSIDRKRAFALATMEYAAEELDIPDENMKVVFTEHPGSAMMGVDRVGGEWNSDE
ncbi:hypothetical protein BDK61_4202 [Haloarcula quadrata]|uniref:Tautomerase-like protein n=2 Tax=Haloarcula quadrata TaxID=182779 RepID=A0A495QX86_9EURY|nr:4-oxalocrotonate tautomerase family protein [Haloarcula quadrata]RKS78536.1 hypothetical protein BDK61_4202 [Haloarcula quadrata]